MDLKFQFTRYASDTPKEKVARYALAPQFY